jgi:hypothetical protein
MAHTPAVLGCCRQSSRWQRPPVPAPGDFLAWLARLDNAPSWCAKRHSVKPHELKNVKQLTPARARAM